MTDNKKVIGPYDPGVIFDLAEQEKLTDQDDAAYKTDDPNFFEWWYFDVHTDQGYTIIVTLKDRDYTNMQLAPVPQIKLVIESPDGDNRTINRGYPDHAWQASTERCDVKIGDQFSCSGSYPKYNLKAKEDDVMLDLEFIATLPGWRPGTGKDYFSPDYKKYFGWVVPQPRANVNGILKLGEKTLNVTGIGYHDHNYGTVPLAGNVARWHWGRTYADDYTIIFSTLVVGNDYGRRALPVFMLGKGSEILLSSGAMETSESGIITTVPQTGNRYAEEILLKIPFNNQHVEMKLKNKKLIEEWDLAPQAPTIEGVGKPAYIRLLADLDLTVPLSKGIDTVSGLVIHEYMLLEMTKYK